MNRIICDICGSEYPETADRCPICDYPRQGSEKQTANRDDAARSRVKGGRYSKRNVKKRIRARRKAAAPGIAPEDKPLIIVIILLLIAIVLVSVYIGLRFLGGRNAAGQPGTTGPAVTTTVPPSTAAPTVPCTRVVLEASVVELEQIGQQYQLQAKPVPEDTTDIPVYSSSDETVATVSETGLITAVGAGQAQITVTWGSASVSCLVDCWFPGETTAPTEPPETTAPTVPPETTAPTTPPETKPVTSQGRVSLSKEDVTLYTEGESFTLRAKLDKKSLDAGDVSWTSSDPSVAAVKDGLVIAVGNGTATITAEYDGKSASCIVRCSLRSTKWRASHTDVSISVGESFTLTVKNGDGEIAQDAVWTMSIDGVVSISGSTVTGGAPGTVTLSATVDGTTVQCIVRVSE